MPYYADRATGAQPVFIGGTRRPWADAKPTRAETPETVNVTVMCPCGSGQLWLKCEEGT